MASDVTIADPDGLFDRARVLADDVLAPAAQAVDRADRIPEGHLRAMAEAGLFGLLGPADRDGLDASPGLARRVVAEIGGGCGATFFVWVQHHGVVRTLRDSDNDALADALLGPMCRGDLVAGTAFAHVRRPGRPAITATRVDGGWTLDGHAPWATSWGIADWFSVAAVADGDRLVWAMIPGGEPAGIVATPLELPVFGATRTVALDFVGCQVSDEHVIGVDALDRWRAADVRRAALAQPAGLGVADRAIRLLAARDGDEPAVRAAGSLRREWSDLWALDDALVAAIGAGEDRTADASAHRAAVLDLSRRTTTALLAASGGAGMALDHPAQRLGREAMFYVIQAQTADGRRAVLERSAARS